jgi:transcriptional regulator GlxA family with amidase domain
MLRRNCLTGQRRRGAPHVGMAAGAFRGCPLLLAPRACRTWVFRRDFVHLFPMTHHVEGVAILEPAEKGA